MSNLQRILNLASKALDSTGSKPASNANANATGTDWRDLVRSAAEKVTGGAPSNPDAGRETAGPSRPHAPAAGTAATGAVLGAAPAGAASAKDRAAIARYDYLLRTADPGQLEQVHREAFARLTPAQREQVEAQLRAELPAYEQPRSASSDDLARAATRGEAHRPGFLHGLLAKAGAAARPGSGGRGGPGRSGAGAALGAAGVGAAAGAGLGVAGGLLAAVAGGAIVTSVAAPLLEQAAGLGVDFESFAGGVGEFTAGADELANGAGEAVSGVGEQVTGAGEQLGDIGSEFQLPDLGGLGSLFDR